MFYLIFAEQPRNAMATVRLLRPTPSSAWQSETN